MGQTKSTWDGVERRTRTAGNAETSLRITGRAAEGDLSADQMFTANNVRPADLDDTALRRKVGAVLNAASLDYSETVPQSLDEAGVQKIRTLFESPDAGYEGYAMDTLRKGGIDPNNLPVGSKPLWESQEAALTELLSHITPARFEVIRSAYREPAIAVEPIRSCDVVYVKDASGNYDYYDRRVVGNTPFGISEWSGQYLNEIDKGDNVGSIDGNTITGWNIGIVDKAKVTKTLATDGNVEIKTLQDRARDFHAKGGHGSKGFTSVMDHPRLYGLMMNRSCSGNPPKPIDDIMASDGVWTMGTKVDDSVKPPRVAGGYWVRHDGKAYLLEDRADRPNYRARVRLAVMFKKAS